MMTIILVLIVLITALVAGVALAGFLLMRRR